MELMTKELERKFEWFPLYSQEGKGKDAEVVVKYFNPIGSGTWLITEGEKEADGDWLFFGYCHITDWEWGYVRLSALTSIKLQFDMKIERDLHAKGTVRELMQGVF